MESLNKEHFRTIRKAIENNKLAIFVGSAVSYDSNLPSWADLIDLMKGALENPRISDYLKVAEHYYLQYGRNTYYSRINEFFPAGCQPNIIHELLLQLKPQHIVTTNWDDLLEKSIAHAGDLYFKVASDHELASSPSSQLLIKMHGDLSHRNIIFKESDYLAYTDKFPLVENFIKSLFSTHVVLFVGYSVSDYNLNQILSWIRNRTQDAPPSFTILTEDKITLSESNYLRSKGVYPLLRDDASAENKIYDGLSFKSIGVARTLDKIINPENLEFLDVLDEIALDVCDWEVVYPSTFVQLFRDRFNTTEINKIYYDSGSDAVVYRLGATDVMNDRREYRKIRSALLKILSRIPVAEFRLVFSNQRFIRVRRLVGFNFVDEYTSFDFELVSKRAASAGISLSKSLDDSYQFAFDNYYLKRLSIARESFMHVASRYFAKSLFVKSLVSSFNKKQLCLGEIPWDVHDGFLETSMAEQLSKNDNISEMVDRFPKSIIGRQKPLFQGLDASNSFLLERFKAIANLSRQLDDEVRSLNSGSMVFSERPNSMYNLARALVLFVAKNKISILYSSDYKNIGKIAFESIVKRISVERDVEVDAVLLYLAVNSFKESELVRFLSDNLKDGRSLVVSSETLDYVFSVLGNTLDSISSRDKATVGSYGSVLWSNTLTIMSFVANDQPVNSRIIANIVGAFDANNWAELSEAVNRFLVIQFNKFGNSFAPGELSLLFDKQLEKINSVARISHRERGRLFSSLLFLIKDGQGATIDFLKDNKELYKFISSVRVMDFRERLRVINGFVFVLYSLATGGLKDEIVKLLKDTFSEAKVLDFSESSIIFGLELYGVGILELEDLYFILSRLREKVKDHVDKRSTSSSFAVINEQLSRVDSSRLLGFEDVVEKVGKLSEAIGAGFKSFNNDGGVF